MLALVSCRQLEGTRSAVLWVSVCLATDCIAALDCQTARPCHLCDGDGSELAGHIRADACAHGETLPAATAMASPLAVPNAIIPASGFPRARMRYWMYVICSGGEQRLGNRTSACSVRWTAKRGSRSKEAWARRGCFSPEGRLSDCVLFASIIALAAHGSPAVNLVTMMSKDRRPTRHASHFARSRACHASCACAFALLGPDVLADCMYVPGG